MKYVYEIGDSVRVTNNYDDSDYFGALAKISEILEETNTRDYRIVFDSPIKNGNSYTSAMNIKSEFIEPVIEKKKPLNLLKEHMDILERLTELASKETQFNERGQFMNIQKMIEKELDIIYGFKNAREAVSEFDKAMDELERISDNFKKIEKLKLMHEDIIAMMNGRICDQSKTLAEKEELFNKLLEELK